MLRFRFFILSALFFLLPVSAFAVNDIHFSKIGIEQGLSQLSVMSIYQDELGYVWFATREGVSRYNGNSIQNFKADDEKNSINGNLVKTICGNRQGSVYILSQGGIDEYDIVEGRMKSLQTGAVDVMSCGTEQLWFAENTKIFTFKDGKKSLYLDMKELKSPVRAITETSDQRLIVGTLASGVYMIDSNKKQRRLLADCSQVSVIFEDNQKNLWIGTWQQGLFKIEKNGQVRNYRHTGLPGSISSDFVRAVTQDNKQNLWIGTSTGLNKMNIESEEFVHYKAGRDPLFDLANESVWALYKDWQGSIWVGSYFGGVNYFYPDIDYYTFHNLAEGSFRDRTFPIISEIVELDGNTLLLGTEGEGLLIYNRKDNTYKQMRMGPEGTGLTSDNIKTSYFDADSNTLWLGTHLGGITRVDISTLNTRHIRHIRSEWDQSDIVRAILPYEGKLLIGTYNGIFLLDKQSHELSLLSEKLHKKLSYCVDMKIAGNNLWVGGRGLYRYNLKTGELRSYFRNENDSNSLSHDNITKLYIDSKERLWVATNGGGINLYDDRNEQFQRFTTANSGLQNNYISNIKESPLAYMLLTTSQGLTVLDEANNQLINYEPGNGFPLNSLYNGGLAVLKSGEIYVAGLNGMVSFMEENVSMPHRSFDLNLVNIWVNNNEIRAGDASGILKKTMPYTDAIKLKHNQSMLSIEFAANDYVSFNRPHYRYRLLGFSDKWNELPVGLNRLNFMNLNPGNYTLELEALSPINREQIAGTSLKIKIKPPIYLAWYAYLFYVLLLVYIIWRYLAFTRSRLLLKTSLEFEKKEKEQLEEVNQSKLRFFTNISHEFRTPLTLIAGQVDMLMQTSNIQPFVYNRILNIQRNTHNMQNLISELLEFRKIEQGHVTLKAEERNFAAFLYEIYLSFTGYADYRNVNFVFDKTEESIKLWFDPQQLQKVFTNLIANAFKFTPKEGTIELSLHETGDEVIAVVADSGSGIDAEMVEKIFDRFYQAENGLEINSMSTPGTGIGLALSKSILEAHQADIRVESEKEVGSRFYVTLKKGRAHFSDKEVVKPSKLEATAQLYQGEVDREFMEEVMEKQMGESEPLYTMLIVEDNAELREMLSEMFEPIYHILTATDGEEGLEMTIEHQPDIVLSDLMMPRMSGSEMCARIKDNFLTSHIPVVLLTAQTAIEYNIEGLRLGADDYITKPFNVKTLITRCNNLVNNRKLLQERFSNQPDSSPRLIATNQLDSEFIERAQHIVEQHLDDNSFDVKKFSQEMALGRTNLFTKLKGITGQTPNEFILNVRMKKAATWLINNPEYNITDITYMVGFSTPKYFSKCFKDQFGVTPTAYRQASEVPAE